MATDPEFAAEARRRGELHGIGVHRDSPDSVIMAELRNACPPGSRYDIFAEALAADLAKHAATPITRATCAALGRASADLQALGVFDWTVKEVLAVLGFAAAKLEMRAKP